MEESGQVRVDRDVYEVTENEGIAGVFAFAGIGEGPRFFDLDTARGLLRSDGVETWEYDESTVIWDQPAYFVMRVRFWLEDPAPAQVRVEVNRAIGSLRQRVLDEMEACRRRLEGIDRALENLYHTQEEAEG